jgi:uncharacterized protein (DUF427 family)
MVAPIRPDPTGPGEESVWRYPRPPALESTDQVIQIRFADQLVASTRQAYRVLETSHPPSYYLPPEDIRMELMEDAGGGSWCEWKGGARYWTLRVGNQVAERVAWSYPDPTPRFEAIKDHLAFYAGPLDSCTVSGMTVTPQPGGFYGGWITPDIKGPFKGGPGSLGW